SAAACARPGVRGRPRGWCGTRPGDTAALGRLFAGLVLQRLEGRPVPPRESSGDVALVCRESTRRRDLGAGPSERQRPG
ncbi:hypothetical protein ABZZ80_33960, partial [Streptomyces sp. NPDC006356]